MHNVAEIVKGAWYYHVIKFIRVGVYGLIYSTNRDNRDRI